MLIEVKGVEFANLGAYMMLQAVISRMSRDIPDVRFALTPSSNCTFQQIAAVGAFQRLRVGMMSDIVERILLKSPAVFGRVANRYGIVLEKNIDAVLDASGYAYGDPWSNSRSAQTAREIRRLSADGKPYVFLPQAFGSFPRERESKMFGEALLRARLVYARDTESFNNLAAVAGKTAGSFRICPDFTLGIIPPSDRASCHSAGRSKVAIVPNSKLLSVYNPHEGWRKMGRAFFDEVVQGLKKTFSEVVVVNSCRGDDDLLCDALVSADPDIESVSPNSPSELISALSGVSLVVSGRYHSCVASLALGIPCIGVSWSHKYEPLFRDFGVGGYVVRSPESGVVLDLARGILDDSSLLSSTISSHRKLVSDSIERMWSEVIDSLND